MTDDWGLIALRLGVATLVGLALGLEREWHGRDAGLRTHALVSLSSALITLSALSLAEDIHAQGGESDPVRVVQGLAQAIGFIAGGLIFVRGGDVQNMTTAASLWMAAGTGIAAGAGQFSLVVIGSAMAILLLLLTLAGTHLLARHRPADADDGEDSKPPSRRGVTQD